MSSYKKSANYEDDFNVYNSLAQKYNKKKRKLMSFVLVIFALCLVAAAFSSLIISNLAYKEKYVSAKDNVYAVFQDSEFGAEIMDFTKYNSIDNAFEYSFYIENGNNFSSKYSIFLADKLNGLYNYRNINYALYKNDKLIFVGFLDNNISYPLIVDKVSANSKDNYVIKFWSSAEIKYAFRVDVVVG